MLKTHKCVKLIGLVLFFYFCKYAYAQVPIIDCKKIKAPIHDFVRIDSDPRIVKKLPYSQYNSEKDHWEHLAKELDAKTLAQLKQLMDSDYRVATDNINSIVRVSEQEYLISNVVP